VRTLTDASAASRTAGLALKAIAQAGRAIMSRSLAPSPTATVWLSEVPGRRREAPQRESLARPVHDRAAQPPGQLAVGDLQRVGGRVVDAELGGQPSVTWVKPPLTIPHR
jgi:hypothetical protein